MNSKHLFPYDWQICGGAGFPAKGVEKNDYKVFGTFSCGGGSSMGFKLAGYHVLGGVEIDARIANYYQQNLHPEIFYNLDVRDFNKQENLPEVLYNLDVLEGSPPCSTFSMAGSREEAWGKEKRFAEGQALQTLDDLVFVYGDTILKLLPKVFILENVKGLLAGNAKAYVRKVVKKLSIAYRCQLFLLNGASMGLPQTRQRVFIIGVRNDLKDSLPPLKLEFHEPPILFKDIMDGEGENDLTEREQFAWEHKRMSDHSIADVLSRNGQKHTGFTSKFVKDNQVPYTITAGSRNICYRYPRVLTTDEIRKMSSFPSDYRCDTNKFVWLMGMSVPPVMMAHIAHQIRLQWLDKLSSSSSAKS